MGKVNAKVQLILAFDYISDALFLFLRFEKSL